MTWQSDNAEYVVLQRPRSIVRMLADLVRIRTERLRAADRGAAIAKITRVLSESGRNGQVTARGPDGDQWSVTLGMPVVLAPQDPQHRELR